MSPPPLGAPSPLIFAPNSIPASIYLTDTLTPPRSRYRTPCYHQCHVTVILDAVPTQDISPVPDESLYTGKWWSIGGGCMSPPPLGAPSPLMLPEVGNITTLPCIDLAALTLDVGPPCGGIFQGSARSWGLSPRSPSQTGGLTEWPPCNSFQRSGGMPPPTPKYWRKVPISSAPSKYWQPPPSSHSQMW